MADEISAVNSATAGVVDFLALSCFFSTGGEGERFFRGGVEALFLRGGELAFLAGGDNEAFFLETASVAFFCCRRGGDGLTTAAASLTGSDLPLRPGDFDLPLPLLPVSDSDFDSDFVTVGGDSVTDLSAFDTLPRRPGDFDLALLVERLRAPFELGDFDASCKIINIQQIKKDTAIASK